MFLPIKFLQRGVDFVALPRCNILVKLPRERDFVPYLRLLLVNPSVRSIRIDVLLHICLNVLFPRDTLRVSLGTIGLRLTLLQDRISALVCNRTLDNNLPVLEILIVLDFYLYFEPIPFVLVLSSLELIISP